MPILRYLLAGGALLAFSVTVFGLAPAPFPRRERGLGLPVGRWIVRFDNGVVETCDVATGGIARVVEPRRNAAGKAMVKGRSVLIVCQDDRVERWSRAGDRVVVEHWFPGSAYPRGTPVCGIAERRR